MAQITGTTDTYSSIGLREDLTNEIWDISPMDTPFMNSIARINATGITHEWQTDSLAAATSGNAQIEGDDVTFSTAAATTRETNKTQIMRKEVMISGTLETVSKAGRESEIAYQVAKRGRELKRDMEAALSGSGAKVTGTSAAARALGGLEAWLSTNQTHLSTDGTTPGSGNTVTDGISSLAALTQAPFADIIRQIWVSGGDPKRALVGPLSKIVISGFSGIATLQKNVGAGQGTIVAAADLFRSDFGDVEIVPSRFSRDRTVSIYDPEFWAVATLRGIMSEPLAKTGDAEKRMLITEVTLEARNEASSGKVADISH
jgi:hypothetical protein